MESDEDSTGDADLDEMDRRVEAATTRDEKLAVLRDYMSHDQARNALGLMTGDHAGDVVDGLAEP